MSAKMLALYVFKGTYAALTLALGVVVATTWGVEDFGLFALLWTVFAVGLVVGSAGTNFYLVELLPKLSTADYSLQFRRMTRLSLASSVLTAIAAAVVLHAIGSYWLAASALVPAAVHVMSTGGLIAEGRQVSAGSLDGVLRPSVTLALTVCGGLLGASASTSIAAGMVGGYLASSALGIWMLRGARLPRESLGPTDHVPMLKPLTVFALMGALTTLLSQADRFVLSANGTPSELASYSAAQNIANVVVYAVNSAAVIALPSIAALMAGKGSMSSMWHTLDRVCRPLVAFAALVTVAAGLFGDRVLLLFGPEFVAGQWPLTILLAGTALSLSFGFPMSVLSMSDARSLLVWHLAAGTCALVAVSILALNHWGVIGVAFANAACALGVRVSMYVHCRLRGLPAYHIVPALRSHP